MNDLQGKVALVTGGSRGIGSAISQRLAQAGATVVINYASNVHAATELIQKIETNGGKALAYRADVSRVGEIRYLFDETLLQCDRLDIIVANAGIQVHQSIADTTEADFDRVFATNTKGVFFTLQEAAKSMNQGGRIIVMSSSLTATMFPGYGAYAGTKGAVEQFVKTLAKEVGNREITVNAVCPGPVETDFLTTTETHESLDILAKLAPAGRLGQPEDIADVVAFLASNAAQWITGQRIHVNGGFA
jgi:3-oxoacyl-[acyl-carrier protein] reductase